LYQFLYSYNPNMLYFRQSINKNAAALDFGTFTNPPAIKISETKKQNCRKFVQYFKFRY